ncbi:uncharacterized protein LOC126687483 [Mercurialis annua]|uniref:uncharacterized protein LOC126687483 n=1 Tax=Mercurialis annua TaxID=3986 RepID=UPI00215E20C8|nr:uncharacterized protein LOC126687483 [Mercurialis annua]
MADDPVLDRVDPLGTTVTDTNLVGGVSASGRTSTSPPSTGPGPKPSFSIGGGTEGYVDRSGVPRQYVPLNTPREQILSWIKHNNEEIRYPPRLVKDGDRSKFCDFHDGYGHETEECGQDAKGVDFPHEDALIVSAIIGSKWVKRLLVDDGSSVNLLTLSVFLTMGGSKTDLKPVNIPLLGLGGAPVTPEGMVELDLELGIEIPQEDGTEGILAEPTRKIAIRDEVEKLLKAGFIRKVDYPEWLANVYVDDIVVKSKGIEDHAQDLAETFEKLKGFNLKLNPEKCVFAVRSGKFLGHLISEKGIEANPEKIEAVMSMKAPSSVKEWTEECNAAFEELKVYLSTPPVLGRPEPGEILYLYLSVNDETAAAVLVKEDKGLQTPVYYLSRVLKGPEVAAEKLRRYFEAHIIVVRTNQPLRKALQRPEMSGRLVSWSVQLGGYDIRYEPRPALKAQVLADFIAETTASDQPEEPDEQLLRWVLEVDGASNLDGSGAGVVLKGPHGVTLRSSVKFDFPASNNAAEYEALLIGLRMELGGKWVIEQVPRLENQEADVLAKAATVNEKISGAHFSVQKHSSIDNHETIFLTQPLENWMQGIAHYLMDGTLPENRDKAYKILRQAPYYAFLDGVLYRKSFTHPWSRCLTAEEGEYVLREIHEGICGAHIAPRMLAKKAVLQGYYWPLMVRQAEEIVKKCENCQRHQNIRHAPTTEQCPITSPWPFATALVTDNGKQFNCRAFKEFCNDLHIDLRFTSVVHPQSNGMTEVTNRTILKGLKARLGEFDRQWLEELPKAMIPVEIGMPTLRVQFFDEAKNEEEQKLCLDLLEERREQAALRIEAYKQRMAKYHNTKS